MTEFKHKTVRCEWHIIRVDVDQYESEQRGTEQVLGVYGSREEALENMPKFAKKKFYDQSWSIWVPLDAKHSYEIVRIGYYERTVKEWSE